MDPIILGVIGSSPEAVARVTEQMKRHFGFRLAVPLPKSEAFTRGKAGRDPLCQSLPPNWAASPDVVANHLQDQLKGRRARRIVLTGPSHFTFSEALRKMKVKIMFVAATEEEALEVLDEQTVDCDGVLQSGSDDEDILLHLKKALNAILDGIEGWKQQRVLTDEGKEKGGDSRDEGGLEGCEGVGKADTVDLEPSFRGLEHRWQPLLIGATLCTAINLTDVSGVWSSLWSRLTGNDHLKRLIGKDFCYSGRSGNFEAAMEVAYRWIATCSTREEEPWSSFKRDGLSTFEVAVILTMLALRFHLGEAEYRGTRLLDILPNGAGRLDEGLKSLRSDGRLLRCDWLSRGSNKDASAQPGGLLLEQKMGMSERAVKQLFQTMGHPLTAQGPEEIAPAGGGPLTLDCLILDEAPWWELRDAATAWERDRKGGDSKTVPPTFLFHGPPGTGKTLAARAIAGTMGLPIHCVAISDTLDKYVGESEKSVGRAFKEAEEEGAFLFIDEADTFLWDRSTAQRAFEASLTNALLQLLDARKVPVAFASNLITKIDPAVQRRLQVIVEFPVPDRPCRERLWRIHLDRFEWGKVVGAAPLAEVALTGALIDNAVCAADRALRIGRALPVDLMPWLIGESKRQAARMTYGNGGRRTVGFGG
jgi:hypothetical protein